MKIGLLPYLAGMNDIVKQSWYQGYEVCDLYAVASNVEIPKERTGTVTKLVYLYLVSGEKEMKPIKIKTLK